MLDDYVRCAALAIPGSGELDIAVGGKVFKCVRIASAPFLLDSMGSLSLYIPQDALQNCLVTI